MRRMTPNQYTVLLVAFFLIVVVCASIAAALASWDPKSS